MNTQHPPAARAWRGVVDEHRRFLPFEDGDPFLSLGEGGTPLVHAPALSERTGCEVHIKVEGMNPTGSFKDRGMVVAMSRVLATDATTVVCASTGNTSASAAAYASRAGLRCVVLLPKGKIAAGKLAQAIVHGAELVTVDGNFDDCLEIARKLEVDYPVALVNSVNPYRLQGQKTAAFEVVDALGRVPDFHLLPVGNAGNISAYWMGYSEYAERGITASRPVMWGFQAAGAAPLVDGAPVTEPETVATAIRIGSPASWDLAVTARRESGGKFEAVTDDRILAAQAFLAGRDGIFVEPASAAGVAGLLQNADAGTAPTGSTVVITVTGNGLKDIDAALSTREISPTEVPASVEAAARALDLS